MEVFVFYFITTFLVWGDQAGDPIHAAWTGRQNIRELECDRLSQADAHTRHPGLVPPPSARGTALMQIDALRCNHRVAADGQRAPRDEVVLARLDEEVGALTGLALPLVDEDARWFVDAYYPDPVMVQKIANASRMALAERGKQVAGQAPLLSGGDLEVLYELPMRDAIPIACRRLHMAGRLKPNDAFLTVALLHRDETQLHAGVCTDAGFRWLR